MILFACRRQKNDLLSHEDCLFSCSSFNRMFIVLLFFCFLFGFFRRTREYFTTIAGEGLQIMTYAQHSWPLSSEGS